MADLPRGSKLKLPLCSDITETQYKLTHLHTGEVIRRLKRGIKDKNGHLPTYELRI